jgi:hypothetical protein
MLINSNENKLLIKAIFFGLLILLFSSCQSPQKTDLRTLAPAETLVYLETNDLGETLQTLTQAKSFQELAKSAKDFSALKNIQVAVIVTGFETSEKQITDESAILNFKPRFALVADTHAWESTAVSLVENQIGQFVRERYGEDAKLDKGEKNGVKFFHWTGKDKQKIFASITGSLIFVGNDETIIEKCLAAKKGEADNLVKNQDFVRAFEKNKDEKNLAFGYVSTDGIAQIANLAGVSAAIETSEEDVVRSFIAKILPVLVQKTAKEIVWTAKKSEKGIEDKLEIKTDSEISGVWKETLIGANNASFATAQFIPNEFNSLTRYNLQNPQIAWRSVLLTSSKQLDAISGKLLADASGSFFEPYGVGDAETFLSAVGSEIVTIRFDEEGDQTAVIAEIKDVEKLKKSLSNQINFKTPPEKQGAAEIWKSADKLLMVAVIENKLILGESESVIKCLQAKENGQNFAKSAYFQRLINNDSATITIGKDIETAQKIVKVLGDTKEENKDSASFYLTETRFDGNGIERKTFSDFGMIGMIIEQFDEE